jgi:DNA-binding transcriptional ArsR family regulator
MATTESSLKGISSEVNPAPRKRASKGFELRFKQAQRVAILLKHGSDPTRLQVLQILSEGEQHVGSLCEQLGQSQPAVSHHLALLRHGGVITPRRQGKNNYYSLTDKGEDLARIVKILIA